MSCQGTEVCMVPPSSGHRCRATPHGTRGRVACGCPKLLTNLMGFSEPTLGPDVPQASNVGYSPGSRIQGVSSKNGLGYSSHLGRNREALNSLGHRPGMVGQLGGEGF